MKYLIKKIKARVKKILPHSYVGKWKQLSDRSDWREYILPNRTDQQFWQEGEGQAMILQDYINKKTDTVLDFGCGIGRVIKFIQAREKIGVDVSQKFLNRIREENIRKIHYDGRKIKTLDDKSVDFIYSIMVFQHCRKKDHSVFLRELRRIMKDSAKCYIQFPSSKSNYYKQSSFVNIYSRNELEKLFKKVGFTKYTISKGNLPDYGNKIDFSINHEYFAILSR